MAYEPLQPTIRLEPELVAAETYVIHQIQEALGAPLFVHINSMVIRGKEPMIIDTGTIANRRQWMDDVFGLVDPTDVRYVYISHDDIDHTGNLAEVMTMCSNATLVASWAIVERHTNAFAFPLQRTIWINDGEHLDLADRRLTLARPPVWDSPTTRGLFDNLTGVYWAVDAFATPTTANLEPTVADLDSDFWRDGMTMFAYNALSPWLGMVNPDLFSQHCDRIKRLGMTTIASAHSPTITQQSIDAAFDLARQLPLVDAPPMPGQDVLDQIVAASAVPV